MSTTYRAIVKARGEKEVEIDGGHRGNIRLGADPRQIASDSLGLALYLAVVNHEEIDAEEFGEWPMRPEAEKRGKGKKPKKLVPGAKPAGSIKIDADGDSHPTGGDK